MNEHLLEILGEVSAERRRAGKTVYRTYTISEETVERLETMVRNRSAFVDAAIALALDILEHGGKLEDLIDTLHVQGAEHLPEALEQAAMVLREAIERQQAVWQEEAV